MPRSADGAYSLPPGTLVNSGDTLLPSQHNPAMQDIAQALSNSLDRNGAGGMRAALDMGGYVVRNAAPGVLPTDLATVAQAGLPIGSFTATFATVAPDGWLFMFGQAVSRTTYADLFAAMGSPNTGDGSTTFTIPDMRGNAPVGRDDMGGTAAGRLTGGTTLGAQLGAQSVTLTVDQMPSHNHGGTTGSAGSHTHNVRAFLGSPSGVQSGAASQTGTLGAGVQTEAAGDHTHTIAAQGGGQSHPNVQPSLVSNFIIKATL